LTALTIAVLVTRLATAVERRDRTLDLLRERNARAIRVAGLTTIVAGAAHELGTPLGTIAVAARELERMIAQRGADPALADDARLIRAEIDRCRAILDQMAGRIAEPIGEEPRPGTCGGVIRAALDRFTPSERARIVIGSGTDISVVWPTAVTAQALGNLIRNALQASRAEQSVRVNASALPNGHVQIAVTDYGTGMRADELARAGEPFFTTKPAGSGMGLGLFVTRAAAEQLGGDLALASTAGAGTTATLTLPMNVFHSNQAAS
jgi:two-component system sensor histidine kinase RegB